MREKCAQWKRKKRTTTIGTQNVRRKNYKLYREIEERKTIEKSFFVI